MTGKGVPVDFLSHRPLRKLDEEYAWTCLDKKDLEIDENVMKINSLAKNIDPVVNQVMVKASFNSG